MSIRERRALIGALPLLAGALGDKYGVRVRFGHYSTAATDGNTILMPILPLSDDALEVLALGFINHEAAHIRFTDFSVDRSPGLHAELTNIIEDLRIETAMMQRYPGIKSNLTRLTERLVDNGFFQNPPTDQQISSANLVTAATLHCGRADVLGQNALDDLADEIEQRLEREMGKAVSTRLRALVGEAGDLPDTAAAARQATLIMQMLHEEAERLEQEDQQGGSNGDQQSDDSASADDGDSDGSSQSDHDQTTQSGGADQANDDADADADADADGDESSGGDSDDQDDDSTGAASGGDGADGDSDDAQAKGNGAGGDEDPKALAESIRRALEAAADELDSRDVGDAIASELDQEQADAERRHGYGDWALPADTLEPHQNPTAAVDVSKVRRQTLALRTRLAAKLEAEARTHRYLARTGRKISGRRLCRVAHGDSRIFERREDAPELNTAVQILVDRSGSMAGTIDLAYEALMATALALDTIEGVKTATAAFPGVAPLTRFHESVRKTRSRYVPQSMGTTPLAESLLWVASELGQVEARRKVVLVITDGCPNNPEATLRVLSMLHDAGVETMGLGISDPSVRGLFPVHSVISSIEELPPRMFEMLDNTLRRRAA